MLVGLLLLSDPLRLTTEHDQSLPPEDRLMSPFWVLMIVALAVVSLFALAAYWYPRLEVTESTVTRATPCKRSPLDARQWRGSAQPDSGTPF